MGLGNSYDGEEWLVAELGIWEVELGGWLTLGTLNIDRPRSKTRDQSKVKLREEARLNEKAGPNRKTGPNERMKPNKSETKR